MALIQRATERALAAGTTAAAVLDLVGRVRATSRAPIVLFTYANPVLRMGVDTFGDRAREAGVDGVLVLVPIEEAGAFATRWPRTRHRRDLSVEPDDHRCADDAPRAWPGISFTASRGWASPARATLRTAPTACAG